MKKMMLVGGAALLTAGYLTLTAFGGGMTKAQQAAQIAKDVAAQTEAYRAELTANCDAEIAAAAKAKYDAWVAESATSLANPPAKTTPKATKKGGKAKVDPLPQPTPPAQTPATKVDEKAKSRMPTPAGTTPPSGDPAKVDQKAKSRMPAKPKGDGGQ